MVGTSSALEDGRKKVTKKRMGKKKVMTEDAKFAGSKGNHFQVTYRNGNKKSVPRASVYCFVKGCYRNYCSSECFNLYHYGNESPTELPT